MRRSGIVSWRGTDWGWRVCGDEEEEGDGGEEKKTTDKGLFCVHVFNFHNFRASLEFHAPHTREVLKMRLAGRQGGPVTAQPGAFASKLSRGRGRCGCCFVE